MSKKEGKIKKKSFKHKIVKDTKRFYIKFNVQ